jgi:uncharacterized repeat protein (TIGR03847 family)
VRIEGGAFEVDEPEWLAMGPIGPPGRRVFFVQVESAGERLSILLEKEQVRTLASEVLGLLERIAVEWPEGTFEPSVGVRPHIVAEPAEPLFRVATIGLGFEPERGRVLLELHERIPAGLGDDEVLDPEGRVVRVYASRAMVRAMAEAALASVDQGRATCPLCEFPMDPDGHACPRWN